MSGRGGPGGPGDTLYYWYRLMHGANNVPIQTTIPLGGGASVTIYLTNATLLIFYEYRDGTSTWFNATGTSVQSNWLDVLNQHTGGGVPTGPAHPGRMGVAGTSPLTSQQRAQAIADAYHGTTPIPTRGSGFSTDIGVTGPKRPGIVQVRAMDPAANAMFTGNGPYLRLEVTKGGRAGPLNFDGQREDNIDHTHFELGDAGEQDDLTLQIALVGTVLYQYQNP
jgi:hypothetical protein